MKRISIFIIAILLFFAQSFYGQETNSLATMTGAEVSIKFFDKTMYYPGNTQDNPIFVRVTIANRGSQTVRFKLADDRMFSIDFVAYTLKNEQLPYTDNLLRKRSTSQTVYFREISLEPGEEYSFTENLKEYLVVSEPSVYYAEVKFFPELFRTQLSIPQTTTGKRITGTTTTNNSYLVTNRLTVEVKNAPTAASVAGLPLKKGSGEILQPEAIAPDKVVEQTIIARQKSLWDQYFLYFDIEQMLMRDPVRNRKYRSESADQRSRMVENYKLDLRQSKIDKDIVAIPESFKIEKTMYTTTEGTVSVIQWFKYDNFKEKKRYVYFVRQRDNIWQIYDYSVENLGTE